MIIAWLSVLVAIIGLLVYLLTNNKASEIGRILFFVGAFFTCWGLAGETVRIGSSVSREK